MLLLYAFVHSLGSAGADVLGHAFFFSFIMYRVYCLHVCPCTPYVSLVVGAEEGIGSPGTGVIDSEPLRWGLGIEPGSCGRTVGACNAGPSLLGHVF